MKSYAGGSLFLAYLEEECGSREPSAVDTRARLILKSTSGTLIPEIIYIHSILKIISTDSSKLPLTDIGNSLYFSIRLSS